MTLCDGSDMGAAERAAREADAVLFVAGYGHGDEGEYFTPDMDIEGQRGGDRHSLRLYGRESAMINALGRVNP